MLLYIYIGFSLVTFVLMWLQVVTLGNKFLDTHKDKVDENHKKDHLSSFFAMFKIFVTCFIPVINIGLFCIIIFCGDKLEQNVIQKVEEKLESKETN